MLINIEMAMQQTKIDTKVTIICDDREGKGATSFIQALIDKATSPIDMLVRRITIGDYAITVNGALTVIFERKTWADLAASIKDGRMKSQQAALLEQVAAGVKVFYIIEGRDYQDEDAEIAHMKFKQLHAKLRHNMLRGLPFIQTRDQTKTAALIVKFAEDCHGMNTRGELSRPVATNIIATITESGPEKNGANLIEAVMMSDAVQAAKEAAMVPEALITRKVLDNIDIMVNLWRGVGMSDAVANILVADGLIIPSILRQRSKTYTEWQTRIANLVRPSGLLLGETTAKKALVILQGAYDRPELRDPALEGRIYGAFPGISDEKGAEIAKHTPLAAVCRGELSADAIIKLNTISSKKLVGPVLASKLVSVLFG
jgi:ERCC4-type nuclease